jgi:sulfate transport system ATP-binding protein
MERRGRAAGRADPLGGAAAVRIEIENLTKTLTTVVLDRINLEIREHEFLGLLGPSGSGKTTLLRILAGLDVPDSGTVRFDGQDALSLPRERRQVSFVFQHYALFNHMTVFDNVAFGLKVRPRGRRPASDEIARRVEELLELVQLAGFAKRFPAQLSGGQRQRVALARALAIEPKVLLLDEPFGALDAKVRVELRRWLREIHDRTGLTTVFVTHDQEEALDLGDRVAVMNRGRIEQIGTPPEIYEGPRTPFVFDFLGRTNAFACEVKNGRAKLGDKNLDVPDLPDGQAIACVRPHDIVLTATAEPPSDDALLPGDAVVRFLSVLGPTVSVELLHERELIEAVISREQLKQLDLEVGSRCRIRLRLPTIFSKAEVDQEKGRSEPTKRHRLRWLRRRRK